MGPFSYTALVHLNHTCRVVSKCNRSASQTLTVSHSQCLSFYNNTIFLQTWWIRWFCRRWLRKHNSTRVHHRWSWRRNDAKLANTWCHRRSRHVCSNLLRASLPGCVASNSCTVRRHPMLTRCWHSACPTTQWYAYHLRLYLTSSNHPHL